MSNSDKIQHIGILTGGGDCPGLNAVIRAVTKTAIFKHGLEVWGIEDGFLGLIRNRMHRLRNEDVSNIHTQGGTILGTSNIANPSHFVTAIDADGEPVFEDVTPRVLEHVAERHLDAIVCIGGDGTMSGAADLIQRGLNVVGVPKTIDNDLWGTEVTFGHDTAVATASDALDKVHTTASSHHRVMVVELMGRYAGWLALHAGIASGADVILIPEIPFDIAKVARKCMDRSKVGKRFTIIAAGEGARPVGGQQFVNHVVADSPDPIRLGGVAKWVAEQVEEMTCLEGRYIVLGHIQRGGTPTAHDRILATKFGYYAFELIRGGQFNRLVVQQNGQLGSIPISEVAHKVRTVPTDHPLIQAAQSIGTVFGD